MVEQVIEIVEVPVGDLHRLAKHCRIGTFATDQPLAHPLVHQRLDHFAKQFLVEPLGQPADLGTHRRIAVEHRRLVDRLVEIFADRLASDQGQAKLGLDQHRGLARRIEVHELVASLPRIFAHQFMRHALLAEHQANLARKGTERELEQLPHGACFNAGSGRVHRLEAIIPRPRAASPRFGRSSGCAATARSRSAWPAPVPA